MISIKILSRKHKNSNYKIIHKENRKKFVRKKIQEKQSRIANF